MASSSAKKGKEKSKQPTTKSKWARQDDDDDVENPDFQSTYFPTTPIANHFFLMFMPYTIVPSYCVEMVCMTSFRICDGNLRKLLERVGLG